LQLRSVRVLGNPQSIAIPELQSLSRLEAAPTWQLGDRSVSGVAKREWLLPANGLTSRRWYLHIRIFSPASVCENEYYLPLFLEDLQSASDPTCNNPLTVP
jgi:hypothetical protein